MALELALVFPAVSRKTTLDAVAFSLVEEYRG
jgi:hypothetical protein